MLITIGGKVEMYIKLRHSPSNIMIPWEKQCFYKSAHQEWQKKRVTVHLRKRQSPWTPAQSLSHPAELLRLVWTSWCVQQSPPCIRPRQPPATSDQSVHFPGANAAPMEKSISCKHSVMFFYIFSFCSFHTFLFFFLPKLWHLAPPKSWTVQYWNEWLSPFSWKYTVCFF